eukprot:3480209-Amphidinium_carterae.1
MAMHKSRPKMWEVHRAKVLSESEWTQNGKKHFLQQSYRHPQCGMCWRARPNLQRSSQLV